MWQKVKNIRWVQEENNDYGIYLLDSVEKIQRFVSIISKYSCDFDIESGHSCIDAKSLVGLFSLDISKPLRLTINDDGTLIEDILRDIQEFMEY